MADIRQTTLSKSKGIVALVILSLSHFLSLRLTYSNSLLYMCRMKRHVHFNLTVVMYELDDAHENRRSMGTSIAADRLRFQLRIHNINIVLEPIFTEEHRLLIRLRNMMLSD